MDDKKVILNKTEFDNMETELNNLRKVVESRTIAKIAVPRLTWSSIYGSSNSYDVQYVTGCDENEVIKELSDEIETLKKSVEKWENKCMELNTVISKLGDWKNLPWYKRLFVK